MSASPPRDPKLLEAARQVARFEAWRRGFLKYLLHDTQRQIYDALATSTHRRHFLCCSRRLGKSFLLTVLCFEMALRKKSSRVLYLAPWAKDAADIVKDAAEYILPDCPPEFRPDYNAQAREFLFKNGSIIRFRGTNGETAQFLRGGSADLVVIDECGLVDDLKHVVNDVVTPMTLTTRGRVILATTPARTPGHDAKKLYDQCVETGAVHEFTILAAPHLTEDDRREALVSAGEDPKDVPLILNGAMAPKTTTAQREYFCQWVTDAGLAVVPEFDAQARHEMVKVLPRPQYFDAYTAMDPGFVDNTGVLFGYWDVREQKLVIEDEWLASHAGTPDIAAAIRSKEKALWGDLQPFMRICDVEKRLISDLIRNFGLPFSTVLKNDSKGAVWNMRQMVKSRQIVIHPRCVALVRQMQNAIWNPRASDMAHDPSAEGLDGHYDLVAALKYLCRTIVRDRNPYPSGYFDPGFGHSRGWSSTFAAKPSIRPDTPISRKLNKKGL
jgi:hypothetical protein